MRLPPIGEPPPDDASVYSSDSDEGPAGVHRLPVLRQDEEHERIPFLK